MPITPFYLGLALFLKMTAPRSFSLTVFTLVQVVIDSEWLFYYLTTNPPYFRVLHTYAGASTVALVCCVLGRYLCLGWILLWNRIVPPGRYSRLYVTPEISWRAACYGAFIGAYSHVFLDSILIKELEPLAPWFAGNSWYGLAGPIVFHLVLLFFGTIGLFWLLVQVISNKYHN
jgi:hypothetical protein